MVLTTVAGSPPCACGLSYVAGLEEDEARHALFHAEYAEGPVLSGLRQLRAGRDVAGFALHVVGEITPADVRERLAHVAMVASREIKAKAGYYGDILSGEVLYLLAEGERAIAMALTALDTGFFWRLTWAGDEAPRLELLDPPIDRQHRRKVARVWVAANHRGKGLGAALVHAVADHHGIALTELGWELPFTGAGAGLVRDLNIDVCLGSGDRFSLHEALGCD